MKLTSVMVVVIAILLGGCSDDGPWRSGTGTYSLTQNGEVVIVQDVEATLTDDGRYLVTVTDSTPIVMTVIYDGTRTTIYQEGWPDGWTYTSSDAGDTGHFAIFGDPFGDTTATNTVVLLDGLSYTVTMTWKPARVNEALFDR